MDWIDLLQWPAMVVTVVAAWMIGSLRPGRRMFGFWCFLLSNLLWVIWGWYAGAWALITLQVCLAAMNIRGLRKNDHADGASSETPHRPTTGSSERDARPL
ncbi:hypothetical protein HKW98_18215 [Stutzerimonas urumqiensis]|uniref:hypothetical protein n=1 Tax=Stutzerimonas urumqiensis TaxID=638269 RepID=UPI003BAB5261